MIYTKRKIIRIIIIILILGLGFYIFYPRKAKTIIGGIPSGNPYTSCHVMIDRVVSGHLVPTDSFEIKDQNKIAKIYDFIANHRVRKTFELIDSGYRGEGDNYLIHFYGKAIGKDSIEFVGISNSRYISLKSWTGKSKMYRFTPDEMDLKKLEELIK